jgi:hypothetical protein
VYTARAEGRKVERTRPPKKRGEREDMMRDRQLKEILDLLKESNNFNGDSATAC